MLTTQSADGSLVSRPLQALGYAGQGELLFLASLDGRKVAELAAEPRVNLGYADSDRQVYVSVRGDATIERDRATIERLWSAPSREFFPRGDPDIAVLRVRMHDAMYWEGGDTFMGRAVDIAHAAPGGAPPNLGVHGRLAPN